jgi:hypothetical protein
VAAEAAGSAAATGALAGVWASAANNGVVMPNRVNKQPKVKSFFMINLGLTVD